MRINSSSLMSLFGRIGKFNFIAELYYSDKTNSMKSFLFFSLLLLLASCGEPDEMETCDPSIDFGEILLTQNALSYFPEKYLNTIEDLILYNDSGDSLVLEYGGKSSSFRTWFSEKECDNGAPIVYSFTFESLDISYINDQYSLHLGASYRLNFDLSIVFDPSNEPVTLTATDYDTCYTEWFNLSLRDLVKNESDFLSKPLESFNCEESSSNVTIRPLETFDALELNGITFEGVTTNQSLSNPDFNLVFYNKEFGFIGFEDDDDVIWTIRP